MSGGELKTFYYDTGDQDHIFWVDETVDQDTAYYEVDYGKREKMMYSGPPGAHKEVIVDAIQRLVDRKHLPADVLDLPLKDLDNNTL